MRAWKQLVCVSLFSAHGWAQGLYQVHGYIQGRFTNMAGTPDRLEIRRARVSVSGNPFAKFSYTAQVDVAKRPHLLDLAVAWRFSRGIQLTGGQFKIPFSTESLISDDRNIPIARSRAVNTLAPGRDAGVQARDVGLQLNGALGPRGNPRIEYATGVFRGRILLESPVAQYAGTAGRVLVHPIKALSIGGDWYLSFSAPPRAEKRREELEGSYERGRLNLRTEQIWARDGNLHRRGGYALGAWELSRHWEPLARADWFTTNGSKPNTTSIAYLAGLNFRLGKHVKIGANTGALCNQGSKAISSIFLAQTTLGF